MDNIIEVSDKERQRQELDRTADKLTKLIQSGASEEEIAQAQEAYENASDAYHADTQGELARLKQKFPGSN